MGLFGDEDAANIPDDPFYVAPNTYKAVVTEAVDRELKDGSGNGVSLVYTIEEPESEYDGMRVSEFKKRYEKPRDELTAQQRQDNSRLKQRLLQLGVPESEMNNEVKDILDGLVGIEVFVDVVEGSNKEGTKTYTNVSKVSLPDDE